MIFSPEQLKNLREGKPLNYKPPAESTGTTTTGGATTPSGGSETDPTGKSVVRRDGKFYNVDSGKEIIPGTPGEKERLFKKSYVEKEVPDVVDRLVDDGVDPQDAQDVNDIINSSNVGNAAATRVGASQMDDPTLIDEVTFDDANSSGLGIGSTDVTTREVQDEELTSWQLDRLLDENSPYIQRAKQRALEMSNARGQLGSSFAAGAATRAAIDAGGEIAAQDAQTYRDAATQNMNAMNEFALAHIQRATALDTALLDANTRIKMSNLDAEVRTAMANLQAITQTNIANLDAATRVSIANLNADVQKAIADMQIRSDAMLQQRSFEHDVGLEKVRQEGRVELTNLDADLRLRLAEAGYEHDFDMNSLDHEQQLEVNEIINGYQVERDEQDRLQKRETERSNMAMQAQMNYINYITAYSTVDMDANAAKRLEIDAWNNLVAEFQMINGMYPELGPITPKRGGTGG